MRQVTTDQLTRLFAVQTSPCISLYLPTHRFHPDNQQDPIRYRNLLRDVEASLLAKYPQREVQTRLEQFRALVNVTAFWNHRTDGLAILSSPETFEIFELQRTVAELVVVADSFHIKPLLRVLQATDRYQVLGINRHEVKLYEGNRDALDEVELGAGVPETIEEALGDELTEPHSTVASYGKGAGPGALAMHHGHGHKKDEVEIDNDRFFRAIDRAILEHHSRPSGLPLILAALPEHHSLFHKVSHNPFLIEEGIQLDPQSISAERLSAEAWRVIEPQHRQRISTLVDNFKQAHSKQQGTSELTEVAQALFMGRVATLMIEADRQIAGKLDPTSGKLEFGDLHHPEVDDVLDDFAELALKMDGQVMLLAADEMPTTTGVAAIYRF